ncbi:MAG: ABC transporter substrate-binding protein [Ilumatobacteraceae bacterium]
MLFSTVPARRTRWKWVAPAIAGVLVLAACSSSKAGINTSPGTSGVPASSVADTGSSTGPDSTGGTPATGSDRIIRVGAVLEPTSLDILTTAGAALDQALLDNVYETLLKTDDSGDIIAGLADMPKISADGLTYTLTIKSGVTFSDGHPLTSADVLWSLQQVTGPDSKSPKATSFKSVTAVDATDQKTIVITLSVADSGVEYALTQRGGAVVEKDATDLKANALGTGPFKFKSWNQGTSLDFVRNDSYWGPKPTIGGVSFVYFTDANALVNAATSGDIDIATGINTDLVEILKSDSKLVVNTGTTTGKYTLGFNNTRKALADQRVRLAIREAIDHTGLIALNNGYGTLLGGPVPPSDPWYEDLTSVAPHDPAHAKQLLSDAGYASGLTLDLVVPNIYPTNMSEFIASELKKVGVTVNVKPVEFSVWLDQVYKQADYDMTIVDHVEARDIANFANPDYYWRYNSKVVQDLIGKAQAATTQDAASGFYKQAARQISEDSPVDWLFLAADVTAAKTGVTGYPLNNTQSRFDASRITVSG